jgi:hypothetical protein
MSNRQNIRTKHGHSEDAQCVSKKVYEVTEGTAYESPQFKPGIHSYIAVQQLETFLV